MTALGTKVRVMCVRCDHSSDDHTLDDASGYGPGDPGAEFRCCWPVKHDHMGAVILCDCPDMVRRERP